MPARSQGYPNFEVIGSCSLCIQIPLERVYSYQDPCVGNEYSKFS